ncbi:hypothetical protein BH11MYX3_BH11MYX3_27820 [soil metagenome]
MKLLALMVVLVACGAPQPAIMQGSMKDADGDGVRDIDDRCAYAPAPGNPDGCPQKQSTITVTGGGADRDEDGIVDNLDKCPDDPEDRDGFQDADGCPDPDNDGDGILDRDDRCPDAVECPGPADAGAP